MGERITTSPLLLFIFTGRVVIPFEGTLIATQWKFSNEWIRHLLSRNQKLTSQGKERSSISFFKLLPTARAQSSFHVKEKWSRNGMTIDAAEGPMCRAFLRFFVSHG